MEEVYNLKMKILKDKSINDNLKKELADEIFQIEKELAINYTPCCIAESEQLPTYDIKELNQLVDEYKNKVMNLETLLESIWNKAYIEGMLYDRIYNK